MGKYANRQKQTCPSRLVSKKNAYRKRRRMLQMKSKKNKHVSDNQSCHIDQETKEDVSTSCNQYQDRTQQNNSCDDSRTRTEILSKLTYVSKSTDSFCTADDHSQNHNDFDVSTTVNKSNGMNDVS